MLALYETTDIDTGYGSIGVNVVSTGTIEDSAYTYTLNSDLAKKLKYTSGTTEITDTYWIASRTIKCLTEDVQYSIYQIKNGELTFKKLAGGINGTGSDSCGIRPVVTLAPNAYLANKVGDTWQIAQ